VLKAGGAFLLLVAFPSGGVSWFAVAALSIYVIGSADTHSPRWRGAFILLAATVPQMWSRVLFRFFEMPILEMDASMVAWLLGTQQTGPVVRFADNSANLVIYAPCSSLANMSLAFLSWVTVTQWVQHKWSPRDFLWCFIACASVVAVNVARICLMGLSEEHYEFFHNQWSDAVTSALISGIIVAVCLLGVRRELFSRT
jgi:exosortase/archaeosortase family protein